MPTNIWWCQVHSQDQAKGNFVSSNGKHEKNVVWVLYQVVLEQKADISTMALLMHRSIGQC